MQKVSPSHRIRRPHSPRISSTGTPAGSPESPFPAQVGCWRIVSRTGCGNYADVFLARPTDCGAPESADYALKRLRPTHAEDSIALRMMEQEVACANSVDHVNVAPVLLSQLDKKPAFFVMPRLTGATLARVLDAELEFIVPQAIWIARQVAEGLGAIHAAGWLHGDLKPANVMVDPSGHATIFDFGFAQQIGVDHHRDNIALMSTLAYTAPERLTSTLATGPASDVYGLGITLFEMLTGRRPFEYRSENRLAEAQIRLRPPSPRSFVPNLPRSLAQLVTRMLAKEPTRRPSTSGELQSLLSRLEVDNFSFRSIA